MWLVRGISPQKVTQVGVPHPARNRAYLPLGREKKARDSHKTYGIALPYPITRKVAAKQTDGAARESHQYRDGKRARTKPYRTGYARGCSGRCCCGPALEAEASLDRGQDVLDDL